MKTILILLMISFGAEASSLFWNFDSGPGSYNYWIYGPCGASKCKDPASIGTKEFWEKGTHAGSRNFWFKDDSNIPGSRQYWIFGTGPGSYEFWKKGTAQGSYYFWKFGIGPGSRDYWLRGEGRSFDDLTIAICMGGVLRIEPCSYLSGNLQNADKIQGPTTPYMYLSP